MPVGAIEEAAAHGLKYEPVSLELDEFRHREVFTEVGSFKKSLRTSTSGVSLLRYEAYGVVVALVPAENMVHRPAILRYSPRLPLESQAKYLLASIGGRLNIRGFAPVERTCSMRLR